MVFHHAVIAFTDNRHGQELDWAHRGWLDVRQEYSRCILGEQA
jgi:hypothetical protein